MVAPTNVRFSGPTQESLTHYVRRTGQTKSGVINTAVEEWLRMQAHPRVRFVAVDTGERRATLIDGPQVWTIAESWLAHEPSERSAEAVADAVGIPTSMVEAGLAYWADYRSEMDDLLQRHRTAQDDALAAWERRQALTGA
jgi:hypothetical protein